jgi:hypothetical protein
MRNDLSPRRVSNSNASSRKTNSLVQCAKQSTLLEHVPETYRAAVFLAGFEVAAGQASSVSQHASSAPGQRLPGDERGAEHGCTTKVIPWKFPRDGGSPCCGRPTRAPTVSPRQPE